MNRPRSVGRQVIPRPADWVPGGPAPWAHLKDERRRVSLDQVRERFAGRQSVLGGWELSRPASAVLVAFYDPGTEPHLVFIRRAAHMRRHAGEVAFPGGRHDPEDVDLRATALREAFEEVRLDPAAVDVIGELDHLTTVVSPTYVKPLVGVIRDGSKVAELVAEPGEVDAILRVPLARLVDPGYFWEERWRWGPGGAARSMSFFDLGDDTLWGATAVVVRRVLTELLQVPDPAAGVSPE